MDRCVYNDKSLTMTEKICKVYESIIVSKKNDNIEVYL